METFTKAQRAPSAPPEMRKTLPSARWREQDSFCGDPLEDGHVISAEHWRAWEQKTRVRGKAHARRITVVASAALLFLWLTGVVTGFKLRGSIHILLFIAVVVLVVHVVQSRRSIL